jgi:hypothetical protein
MRTKIIIACSLVAAFIIGAAANAVTTSAYTPMEQQMEQAKPRTVVAARRVAAPAPVVRYVEPAAVETRPVVVEKKKRSWEREALIVGGSAGAGAAIGAVAGGKKGAGIGAVSGGIAGLIYDLATRNK